MSLVHLCSCSDTLSDEVCGIHANTPLVAVDVVAAQRQDLDATLVKLGLEFPNGTQLRGAHGRVICGSYRVDNATSLTIWSTPDAIKHRKR